MHLSAFIYVSATKYIRESHKSLITLPQRPSAWHSRSNATGWCKLQRILVILSGYCLIFHFPAWEAERSAWILCACRWMENRWRCDWGCLCVQETGSFWVTGVEKKKSSIICHRQPGAWLSVVPAFMLSTGLWELLVHCVHLSGTSTPIALSVHERLCARVWQRACSSSSETGGAIAGVSLTNHKGWGEMLDYSTHPD